MEHLSVLFYGVRFLYRVSFFLILSHMEDIYSMCLLNFYICTSCINCLGIITTELQGQESLERNLFFYFFFIALRKPFERVTSLHYPTEKLLTLLVHPSLCYCSR